MSRLPNATPRWRSPYLASGGQPLVALSLIVSAWTFVAGFAIVAFAGHVTPNRDDVVQKEVLGFAYAFSVSGMITGAVVLAISGESRRAVGLGTIGGMLLAASIPALRWLVFRLTAPNSGWARREWDEAIERIGPSLAIGVSAALVVSGLVPAASFLARRMTPWRFGLVVAAVLAILGLWLLPLAVSDLTDRAIPYLHWHYGHRQDEALRGAATGAFPGALAGAIVPMLITRWLGTSKDLGA